MAYVFVVKCLLSVGLLPRNASQAFGSAIGRLWHLLDVHHRRIVCANLRLAYGNEKSEVEIRRISQDVFQNLGKLIFEIGWLMRLSPQKFGRYFEVRGWKPVTTKFGWSAVN